MAARSNAQAICSRTRRRPRRTVMPIAPKPRIISAQLSGSGTAGAFMLPAKSIETWVGRVVASETPVPLKVPEAPSNRPVPPRIVNNHAVLLIPGVAVGVEPPSKVPLKLSVPKSMMKVPLDNAPPSERQVLVL